jgi:3-oxoacyl-[acyl-carrier protein] reductase
VDAVIATARECFGDPDIVVVNGGGPPRGPAHALDVPAARDALESLLFPAIRFAQALLPGMRRRRWGRLIAIGSSGIPQPIPDLATSNVGRAALAAYLKTLAGEVAADGVTVNVVIPGRIDTDRARELDERTAGRLGIPFAEARDRSVATIPAGRLGEPDEFAAAVAFLASDAASYITGSHLRVDGGLIRGL